MTGSDDLLNSPGEQPAGVDLIVSQSVTSAALRREIAPVLLSA